MTSPIPLRERRYLVRYAREDQHPQGADLRQAARDAVTRHYRTTAQRIMPVHVLHYAEEIRTERAQRTWEQANGHPYAGAEAVCDTCGLPAANQRHRAA